MNFPKFSRVFSSLHEFVKIMKIVEICDNRHTKNDTITTTHPSSVSYNFCLPIIYAIGCSCLNAIRKNHFLLTFPNWSAKKRQKFRNEKKTNQNKKFLTLHADILFVSVPSISLFLFIQIFGWIVLQQRIVFVVLVHQILEIPQQTGQYIIDRSDRCRLGRLIWYR